MPASAPMGAMRQNSQVKNKDIEVEVEAISMDGPAKDNKISSKRSTVHSTINVTKFSDT